MNYSDLMDAMAKKPRNAVKLTFPIAGEPGKVLEVDAIIRIVSKDIDGTTIEILDLQQDDGSTEMNPPSQVIPSPS